MYHSRTRLVELPSLRLLAAASLSAFLTCSSFSAHATVAAGSMSLPRMFHQASTMPDGRIFISGGYAKPGTAPYASAEIYDPASGLFSPVAPMLQARTEHAAVTLNDGRIMAIGGSIATSPALVGTNTAEIYDPVSGQWSATGNLNIARARVLARVLPDGKVFVMNKDGYSGTPYAEIYDPQTGIFSKTGNMVEVSGWHGLVVLADGRVLKVGGSAPTVVYSRSAEIWDPATNQWSATGSMSEARQDFRPILLPDGKVLVAGGSNTSTLKTTEVYDPATGLFTPGSPMPEYLKVDSSTALANGDIILTGPYTTSLIRYQTSAGLWNVTGPKRNKVREGTVSLLPKGNLLLAGGAAQNDATTYAAEWDVACAPQNIALPAATQSVIGDGGVVSWNVTAAPGCRFEAADLPAWLTLATSATLQMSETGTLPVSFTAAANTTGATRTASFMLGNNTATVTQTPSPSCPAMPTLTPGSFTFTSSATNGTMSITAAASCPWSISALPSWVTATSSTSGFGNGNVTYAVAANTGIPRSGDGQLVALSFNKTFTMSQDAPPLCPTAPALTPAFLTLASAASSGTINVSAAASCPWSIGGVPSWMSVPAGTGGTGNGNFTYSIAENSGAARSGSGWLSGPGVSSTFNVNQSAPPCASWSISPSSTNFPTGSTSGSFAVTAASTCNWSLGALPSWMSTTSSTTGSGNGTIGYTVAANTGAARSATALLSGSGPTLSLSLNQVSATGPACSNPITSGVPVNGRLQYSVCPIGTRGSSYYTDRYTFFGTPGQPVTILLTSSSFDSYVYLRNPAGSVIISNDDGGGGTNSRIPAYGGSYVLPAGNSGVYTIEVTSYYSSSTGTYTLNLTQ